MNLMQHVTQAGMEWYNRLRYPRFYRLQQQTPGMLRPKVYKTMCDLCARLPDLDIIEVGGAAGAGSIAIAWAIKDAGKQSHVITVEKCEGGSRAAQGYATNLDTITHNFQHFGVEKHIRLYPHALTFENASEVFALIETQELAAFIHDADGRLDRDFTLFWPRLVAGGLIMVDDYANRVNYQPLSDRYPQGGVKKVMTYRLLNQIVEWGLFEPHLTIGDTIFGYKPAQADFSRFQSDVCARIITEIEAERVAYLQSKGLQS